MRTPTLVIACIITACGAPLSENPHVVAPNAAAAKDTTAHAAVGGPRFEFELSLSGTLPAIFVAGILGDSVALTGSSTVRFLVDTTGMADMTTFEVVKETNPRFTAAMRKGAATNAFTREMMVPIIDKLVGHPNAEFVGHGETGFGDAGIKGPTIALTAKLQSSR